MSHVAFLMSQEYTKKSKRKVEGNYQFNTQIHSSGEWCSSGAQGGSLRTDSHPSLLPSESVKDYVYKM